jgi:VWFA-related protein
MSTRSEFLAALGIAAAVAGLGTQQRPPASPPAGTTAAPQTAAPQPADQRPPTFRAGVNFVRVDAYPTAAGKPVGDLAKEDFEILEDGVPQTIATFEHISVRPGVAPSERVEPRNTRESNAMAADPRNRLFVLFLDTFHVTDPTSWHDGTIRMSGSPAERKPVEKKPLGKTAIDKAIVNFLDKEIGPDDLVAAMSPEMDPRQLTFTRRPESFDEWVSTVWGRRFSWDDLDPEEERWAICYPPDSTGDPFGCYTGIMEEMVLRRREDMTLRTLRTLVDKLGDLREGRKAVLVISEGWAMYRPNQQLARAVPSVSTKGCPAELPSIPGIYVGPGGKLQTGTDPKTYLYADRGQCQSARTQLASLNDEMTYRQLLDQANRANVTFYPVDPRGLAVFDTPIDARPPGAEGANPLPGPVEDQRQLESRLETLRTLASATDGTMTLSNDLNATMKKIAEDLSEYYLLGYNSTNAKLDGKFRRLTVRVKRPGVQVRARRGYLAPTEAEVKARAAALAAADPEVRARETALSALDGLRPDRPLRLLAGYLGPGLAGAAGAADATSAGRLWVIGELDQAAARQEGWAQGGQASITVTTPLGDTVATEHAAVSPAARAFVVRLPGLPDDAGAVEYLVRVRLQGRPGSLADATEQAHVVVPEAASGTPSPLGDPLVFRRGPYTGPAFQPTADNRFRKAERIRVDVPLLSPPDSVAARALDRKGQPLSLPVPAVQREDAGMRFASAEVVLAPLAPGDYVIEISARFGAREAKVITAIRIVP